MFHYNSQNSQGSTVPPPFLNITPFALLRQEAYTGSPDLFEVIIYSPPINHVLSCGEFVFGQL